MSTPKAFGRYQVLDLLGSGAMGEVYKCVDPRVYDKAVAIKVMLARLARNPTAVKRFENEVKTAATLDHPSIVSISDRGESEDGRPYFVMEYLEGDDLRPLTSGKDERPLEGLLEIGRQISEALDFAHARKIVHRDIKPSNMFVIRRGDEDQIKLLDFGIVHIEGSDMTHTTEQPGTFNYMAPEVMRGSEATIRSDLFSLGIVLYELFTHTHPFQAPTQPLILGRILDDQPTRPRKVNPDIPIPLESMIIKLLDKDPEQRPHRAREVAAALRDVLTTSRSTGVGGTPSDFSADQVTGQMVQALKERARHFVSDGNRADALKLLEKALALSPGDGRLQTKVEQLRHDIASGKKVTDLLEDAARALGAGDRRKAEVRWQEAWLLEPNSPQVVQFKSRLGVDDPASIKPRPSGDMSPEVLAAVELCTQKGDFDAARAKLIDYVRSHPGDKLAVRVLNVVITRGDLGEFEPEAPPKAWSDEEQSRIRQLGTAVEELLAVVAGRLPAVLDAGQSLAQRIEALDGVAADDAVLQALEAETHRTEAQVADGLAAMAREKAVPLQQRIDSADGVVEAGRIAAGRQALAALQGITPETALDAGAAALGGAFDAIDRLDAALEPVLARLRERIAGLGPQAPADLARRIESWDPGTESLAALVAELDATEGARAGEIAKTIRMWLARFEGSSAMEPKLLERFGGIADELEGDPATAASRVQVGLDAVEALSAGFGRATSQWTDERAALTGALDELKPWIPADGFPALYALATDPLPDELGPAEQAIAHLRAAVAEARAGRDRQEQAAQQHLAGAVEKVRGSLDNPWLETEVASIDGATTDAQALVTCGRQAQEAAEALRRALVEAGDGSLHAASRLELLEQAAKQASAAAGRSRKEHEAAARSWEQRRVELQRETRSWQSGGFPQKLQAKVEQIHLPASSPELAGAAIRDFVQQVAAAGEQAEAIRDRISRIAPELLEEATALRAEIAGGLKGARFPRIGGELRGRLSAAMARIDGLGKKPALAELIETVEAARDTADEIGRNWLPVLAGAAVLTVAAVGAWLFLAPRSVVVHPGLGAEAVWLQEVGAEDRIQVPVSGGSYVFSVSRGQYDLCFGDAANGPAAGTNRLKIGLFTLPAPFAGPRRTIGASSEDRIFDLLSREVPDLFSDP